MGFDYNDAPITTPDEDVFGVDAFARTLASGILALDAPKGSVISLNGVWGSGKSSAANLVLHHLETIDENAAIKIVRFASWWFRGEEALALAFFRELHAALGPSLKKKAKTAIAKIGSRLLKAGPVAGPAIDAATGGMGGTLAVGALRWAVSAIEDDENVEALHKELSTALQKQPNRFVVVMDDLDRLAPDELLLMFRLVKSFGMLPNVIYLMVYDRQIADRVVSERYPTEGPHFLEKIVQASFELPPPSQPKIQEQALKAVGEICGSIPDNSVVEFMNVFYDIVAPLLATPRDLKRLAYNLAVTWGAVRGDVNTGDLLAIESLRLFDQPLYRTIRANRTLLCGTGRDNLHARTDELIARYDAQILGPIPDKQRDKARTTLRRLFPRTDSVWGNFFHSSGSSDAWNRDRRICSEEHFETYFRFSIGDDTLHQSEIDRLLANISVPGAIADTLRRAASEKRAANGTRAALILDQLNIHADSVEDGNVLSLISSVFEVADEIDVEADEAGAFEIGNNPLRIHWLSRKLTQRFSLAQRSKIFKSACKGASLAWLVDFSSSAYDDYHPRRDRQPAREEDCLTTEADAEELRKLALRRIRGAAKLESLFHCPRLAYVLFRWKEFAGDDGAEAHRWTGMALGSRLGAIALMNAFTSYGWSQSAGDRVAKRNMRANVKSIDDIVDTKKFKSALKRELRATDLDEDQRHSIKAFLKAWDKALAGNDD